MSEEVINLIKFERREFSLMGEIPEPTEEEQAELIKYFDEIANEKIAALMWEIFHEKLFYRFSEPIIPRLDLVWKPSPKIQLSTGGAISSLLAYGYC